MGTTVIYVFAIAEMAIIIGSLAGYKKKWTYGAVLVLHAISTLSSYKHYFAPFAPPVTYYSLPPGRCWPPVSRSIF